MKLQLLLPTFFICFAVGFGQQSKIDSLHRLLNESKNPDLYSIYALFAHSYYNLRLSDSVIHYRKKALTVTKNDTLRFYCFEQLSNIYYIKRDFKTSITYLDSCKLINQKIFSERFEERIHFRLGKIQAKSGYYDEAEENLFKSLNLGKKRDSLEKNVGATYLEIARLYKLMRKRDLSLLYFKKALRIYKLNNRNQTVASLYGDISGLLIRDKKYKEALLYAHKGIDLLNEINNVNDIGVLYSRLGRLYYLIKPRDFKKSYYYLTLADSFRRNDELENIMHSKRYWFNHYQLQGKTDSATTYFNRYLKLNNSLNKTKQNDLIAKFQVKYQTEKKEKENLQLRADMAQQTVRLAQESKHKWQLGAGLLTTLLALAIFTFYYRRNKKQKETIISLQKELHHRIKNNLSIIDTFIELTKEEFKDPQFSLKLTELQNRIESINQVHQQLYNNKDVTNLNLKNYIDRLAKNVECSFSNKNISIEKSVKDQLHLNADKTFPVGLIINEFLTNSFKYAFGPQGGKVKIQIIDLGKDYQLSLSDNGKGLPEHFDLKTTETFGLRIIKLLTEQLHGDFKLSNKEGVNLKINFPK